MLRHRRRCDLRLHGPGDGDAGLPGILLRVWRPHYRVPEPARWRQTQCLTHVRRQRNHGRRNIRKPDRRALGIHHHSLYRKCGQDVHSQPDRNILRGRLQTGEHGSARPFHLPRHLPPRERCVLGRRSGKHRRHRETSIGPDGKWQVLQLPDAFRLRNRRRPAERELPRQGDRGPEQRWRREDSPARRRIQHVHALA